MKAGIFVVMDDARRIQDMRDAIGEVVVGYQEPVDLLLVALLAEGHVLLEDVPGVGKTLLARTVAHISGLAFGRIQFTPDLLPSDVTGINVFNPQTRNFEFEAGPVFTNILLADEINRATPRTQSALLECMQERQVTISGTTRPVPRPFFTIATQNPVDMSGTFPLPSAQMDRFLLRIHLGYPTEDDEMQLLDLHPRGADPDSLARQVCDKDALSILQQSAQEVFVSEELREYVVQIVRATREHEALQLGASPRSAIMLASAARALALIRERDYVTPDDIQSLLIPVLAHRIVPSRDTSLRGKDTSAILEEIAGNTPVPVDQP